MRKIFIPALTFGFILLGSCGSDQEQSQPESTQQEKEGVPAQQTAAGMTVAEQNLQEGKKFLEANAKKEGIISTASGLQYQILKEGKGEKPKLTDQVVCDYAGTLLDGQEFDSSYKRGEPAQFPVNRLIPGWTEALQLMPVGSKWRLFVPSDLAYGPRGAGGVIPPNATLIFELELHKIVKK
jgi:FKBP-type peptidyl-prolyl cis-trans isomerase